jgi:hypothetical protein
MRLLQPSFWGVRCGNHMDSKYRLADGARNAMNRTVKPRTDFSPPVPKHVESQNEKEPNDALEGRRLLVTISAISVLRTGTDRAKQPSPSA